MFTKLKKFWYFHCANPVMRRGEKGAFKWTFRRFWLDIRSISGNFRLRFTASEHPFGYLAAGKTDDNIQGYASLMYFLGCCITTDQQLVDDVQKALRDYEERLMATPDDETDSEEAAIDEVKGIQKYVEMSPKERRQYERDVDKRFKKSIKNYVQEGTDGTV